jgi:hypothetical protein
MVIFTDVSEDPYTRQVKNNVAYSSTTECVSGNERF